MQARRSMSGKVSVGQGGCSTAVLEIPRAVSPIIHAANFYADKLGVVQRVLQNKWQRCRRMSIGEDVR